MPPDLTPIFRQYEKLRDQVDAAVAQVQASQGPRVACRKGCSDCCHALFDLSLVEAMYVNRAFAKAVPYGRERSDILTRADEVDRKLARIKRDFFREEKSGVDIDDIMTEAARTRLRCPLLDSNDLCLLYEARPITCRVYGIPTSIGGRGHVCGFSGFEKGGQYPTVKLDKIQVALVGLSRAIGEAVGSRYDKLHEVYMPLSMALLTKFDNKFLGFGPVRRDD